MKEINPSNKQPKNDKLRLIRDWVILSLVFYLFGCLLYGFDTMFAALTNSFIFIIGIVIALIVVVVCWLLMELLK